MHAAFSPAALTRLAACLLLAGMRAIAAGPDVMVPDACGALAVFDFSEAVGARIPPVEDEVDLIGRYGAEVLGIALNGEKRTQQELVAEASRIEKILGLPVSLPLVDRGAPLFDAVERFARGGRR